jgi:hypothetical protein
VGAQAALARDARIENLHSDVAGNRLSLTRGYLALCPNGAGQSVMEYFGHTRECPRPVPEDTQGGSGRRKSIQRIVDGGFSRHHPLY